MQIYSEDGKPSESLKNDDRKIAATNTAENTHNVQIGVFFCHRRNRKMKLTLLWHTKGTYEEFGKLLKVTAFYQRLRQHDEKQMIQSLQYEYFSSNCCKIGTQVGFLELIFTILLLTVKKIVFQTHLIFGLCFILLVFLIYKSCIIMFRIIWNTILGDTVL